MSIFAVVGMCGSGKSTATEFLEKNGFSKIRFGQITIDEIKKRNLSVNEKNEKKIREELRKKHGMAAYAILNIPKIISLLNKNNNIVLDGLYSWEEYLILKEEFPEIKIICIYASPEKRYQRLSEREIRPLTEEEAFLRDKAEIEKLHKAGPIAMADHTLINNKNIPYLESELRRIING
ncbi:AAA family ATPase [Candidatus Woesearchaeota archaeon]|nr:AAA family ATPase [Candidatus Woesearchaeota archaeon]